MVPECGGTLSYLGEDAAEQLVRCAAPSGLSGVREKHNHKVKA